MSEHDVTVLETAASDLPFGSGILSRLLYPRAAARTAGAILKWWEKRRLSYNLIVGGGAGLSVVIGMTMGIVVDDSIHFLTKYLRARREQGLNADDAKIVSAEIDAMRGDGSLQKSSLLDLFQRLIDAGHSIRVVYVPGQWLDVDDAADVTTAGRFL